MPNITAKKLLRAAGSMALGLCALALVLAGFLIQQTQDIRPILLVVFAAYFGAVLFAPSAAAAAATGLAAMLLMSYFGLAFSDHRFLLFAVIAALLASVAAVVARRFKLQGQRARLAVWVPACTIAAGSLAYGLVPAVENRLAFETVDKPVAPFAVRSLYGETLESGSWRGKVVVVSFWATWCPPCVAEMPKIAALQDFYRRDPGVEVIALNAGYGGDTPEKARAFLERHHWALASQIDDIGAKDSKHKGLAGRSLGLEVVPSLFIVSPAGKLVAVHVGYDESEDLQGALRRRVELLRASN